MSFWATNALSGRICSFGTRISFQAKHALSGRTRPFVLRMTYQAENTLSRRKHHSAATNTRLCPKGPCIIQHWQYLLMTLWKSSVSHIAPIAWYSGYILHAKYQSWCVLERWSSWRSHMKCLECRSQRGQQSLQMPPVCLNYELFWGCPLC